MLISTVLCGITFDIFAADIDGDHIIVDGKTYAITNAYTLVDADLALMQWRAKGNSTGVTGVLEGQTVTGFEETYNKIYDMLLALYDDKSDKSVLYYDISKSNTSSSSLSS